MQQLVKIISNIIIAALLNKYQLKLPNRKFSENNYVSILNSNIDDCAKSCMDSLSFECKSFEFCYLNGQCRLNSDKVNPNSQNQYVIANDCDIYERKNSVLSLNVKI